VVRRPAGGGAVLVAPEEQVWIDLWIPRGDDLWEDDVVRSSTWVGRVWAAAMSELGVSGPEVNEGRSVDARWSRLVCFAGLGPGEVTVNGQKVVGIAQRRTRRGARFFTVAAICWQPVELLELLSLEEDSKVAAASDLAVAAAGLGDVLGGDWSSDRAHSLTDEWERAIERHLP